MKKKKQSKSISGVLLGKTSNSSKAKAIAGFFRKCPVYRKKCPGCIATEYYTNS